MATEAAWLNESRLKERRKRMCALTSTGLLMEGLDRPPLLSDWSKITYVNKNGRLPQEAWLPLISSETPREPVVVGKQFRLARFLVEIAGRAPSL
jgi:hypothetical protein